jgi:hypothetical protein
MRLLRSQTARWRSRPAGIVDLPCCYILLRVIGTIQFCVFEQEDDERGFLVNEGARRGCVMSSFGSLVEQKQGVQRRFSMKRLVNVKWHAC